MVHIIKFNVQTSMFKGKRAQSSKEKASLSKLFPALPLSAGEGTGGVRLLSHPDRVYLR